MSEQAASVQLKRLWKRSGKHVGLREFVKALADAGDATATRWFENKNGACNQERKPENATKANLSAQASYAARKKKSSGQASK
jgi:hypothetical protein